MDSLVHRQHLTCDAQRHDCIQPCRRRKPAQMHDLRPRRTPVVSTARCMGCALARSGAEVAAGPSQVGRSSA